jgi:hypothetical protein
MLSFLGIGAQKAGTTWLYEMLRRHPGLAFPAGKEVHFWDANRHLGLEWYRAQFADSDGRKVGEITPAYAILPLDTIQEIYRFNPALRLLYIIRDPIQRAWSAALMAVGRAEMREEEASDQWFIDHFRSAGSMQRGDYEQCLRNWRRVFPTEQLLVVRYETIEEDPLGLLRACCRHLQVDEGWFQQAPPGRLRERVFAGHGTPIRPSLLPVLREIYRPKVQSLAAYLGADLSSWLDG